MTPDEYARFRTRLSIAPNGCWLWTGSIMQPSAGRPGTGGYSLFSTDRTRLGHRISYEHHVGEIPAGMQIDHECHNRDETCHRRGAACLHRRCVNPDHLRLRTPRENVRAGRTLPAANAVKTHCPRTHPYDAGNTYVDRTGRRHCRACQSARSKVLAAKRKAARHAKRPQKE
jgi:hypothetical protein